MSGMEEFRDLYIQTAKERLQQLNDLMLKLEQNPEHLEVINELMRTGHSLKGESAAMGFEQIATLAHVIEDLFTSIGASQLKINKDIMDALFGAVDYIQSSVEQISSAPDAMDPDSSACVKKLKELTGLKTEGFGKSAKTEDGKLASDASTQTQAAGTPNTPAPEQVTVEAEKAAENKAETSASQKKETHPNEATGKPSASQQAAVKKEQITSVTLKIDKLDKMISISEELVLLKMKLKNTKVIQQDNVLKADIHLLDRLVTDLQFHIMQARLFPISLATMALPRLVRDLSSKTGKKARLVLEGQDTTVDRSIIDHLTEPFTHMIRNAIDHGIEAPADRIKLSKPEEATITVRAYTKENRFVVEVIDDGCGIEWEKVVKSAIKKGFTTESEAAKMTLEQKQKLLFIGGVSTSEQITDVSGRGVGMSAVYAAIKNLGGDLYIDSTVGQGTTFTFKLPMTLAIMRAMLVKVDNRVYALPADLVVRSIQLKCSDVISSAGQAVTVVDNQNVPLMDLGKVFATQTNEGSKPAADDIRTTVLIRHNNSMFGLIVDKIVAEEEVLVKPLGSLLKKQSNYFSGATILADGAAAPIINIEGLKWTV